MHLEILAQEPPQVALQIQGFATFGEFEGYLE
jgi:hypothetical protein